jgi:hypothetical protein
MKWGFAIACIGRTCQESLTWSSPSTGYAYSSTAAFGIGTLDASMHIHPRAGWIFGYQNWQGTSSEILMRSRR